jgi:hypothetical protein
MRDVLFGEVVEGLSFSRNAGSRRGVKFRVHALSRLPRRESNHQVGP